MTVTISAWRQTFQAFPGGPWLDHTYVGQSPGAGSSPPPDYFACWNPNFVVTQHPVVVTGNINNNCANCYRDRVLSFPDTAGIGIYGINGVCHQSANCFLYSAGPWSVTLNFSVRGYWASLLAYGVYGTGYLYWLAAVYGVCAWLHPSVAAEAPEAAAAEPVVSSQFRGLYKSFLTQAQPPSQNDMITQQAEAAVTNLVPGFDPSVYRDLHAQFLSDKDTAIATGVTGQALADTLNELSSKFQLAVAGRVGPSVYKQLNGVDAGETVYLCDPRLAEATGVPVPPFKQA
jgi:hypothetical protein